LQTLSETEQANYIHNNFYKIYGADLTYGKDLSKHLIDLSAKNRWKELEGWGYTHLGVTSFLKGDYNEALPAFIRSSKIFDSLKHYNGLAAVNNEMSVFFGKQKQYETSLRHIDLALKYSELAGNLEFKGTALHHKAVAAERDGKVEEAMELYYQVYDIRLRQKDSVGLGYILQDIALVQMQRGKFQEAIALIDQSSIIRRKLGDRQGLAVSYVNAGETHYAAKNYREAIRSFHQCLVEAKQVGFTDLIKYTYDQLALAHIELNDYKAAFQYQSRARQMQDSLFNIDRTKVIADLQTKYESEKKQQQIELQNATMLEQRAEIEKNFVVIISLIIVVILLVAITFLVRTRLQRKQELLRREHDLSIKDAYLRASIQSQELERKRFAQDLHDGMGQLISSLRIAVAEIGDDMDTPQRIRVVSKSEKILHEMHHEIRSIAFNLMPQTLIRSGLLPALEEMAHRINDSGKMRLTASGFDLPERLSEAQEISLYRVIQEWVNNVMKYAEATSVEIQLVGYEDEITITVEDNGRGFDTSVLEKGNGHGWRNIQSRLSLIKSPLEIDSRPDVPGTTLILHVPRVRQFVPVLNDQ
jgi:signal transduction histidine kinase